jgi:3-isopropylmalate dehydratase small subunit
VCYYHHFYTINKTDKHMPIDKFVTLESSCVPLPIENVDTDQIIPARFLKATTREGFGDNLFCDWRYDKNGNPKADFVLNKPEPTQVERSLVGRDVTSEVRFKP